MKRRGFVAALGAGAVAGLAARPSVATAALDDVSFSA